MTMKIKMRNKPLAKADKRKLSSLRQNIDAIDLEIVHLLNKRALYALKTGMIKKNAGIGVYDQARERQVFERVQRLNRGLLGEAAIKSIYRSIISACRARQK